ncbi:hypothetical protein QOZ80_4AG0321470 [Eleusine coracana subsp. coracana]|nr:hypothetical protein QOZ80_4AG0321470 [Eleusine coracana subsp. coracana]
MALAAAARSRRLADHLFRCLHPALPHLLTRHCSGDNPTTPAPLHPLPSFRSPHFPLPQSSGTARTLTLFPFGLRLTGAGLSRRGFSSLPSYRVSDASAVLTDAADAAVAPASFPSEVAWAAEDSSLSVAAVQHLIDAVHSYTGFNWGLSIAISTVLLRSVLFTLSIYGRKQVSVMQKEYTEVKKMLDSANDGKSRQESIQKAHSIFKRLGIPTFVMILTPYTFMTLYFAISNMVDKLPLFKEGGAFWFTDLTTPDALYIFPAMTSLLLLLRLEFVLHYSRTERCNETAFLKTLFVLTFPLAASFPQESCAISTYFVAWSFAPLTHMIVLNQPAVKKLLHGDGTKPACPSSDGHPVGPIVEDSTPVEEHKKSLPSEKRGASDSSVDGIIDQSDKKSEKDD